MNASEAQHVRRSEQKEALLSAGCVYAQGYCYDPPMTAEQFENGQIGAISLLVACGLAPSRGEARRLITQGGVLVKGEKVTDPTVRFTAEDFAQEFIIKKGKKVFHLVQMGE